MITFHKAQEDDIERISYAIIMMKNDDKAITTTEVKEWLDHTYYLYDDQYNLITSVIAAVRCLVQDTIPSITEFEPTRINMQRYEIKYLVDSSEDTSSLIEMVRECLADMNDCATIYYSDELDVDNPIEKALRSNGFKYNKGLKCYMRMPMPEVDVNLRYL